jgi:hypothetical protein
VEPNWEARKADEAKRAEANDRIEQVVSALRLHGVESVFPVSIIHRTNPWAFGHDRMFPCRFQPDFPFSTQLGEQQLGDIKQLWEDLQSERVKQRKYLDVAIRRFSYAHDRYRLEDRIVDLMIAAESLFLSDFKKDNYIGELRYRLSLRAACFLASDGEARKLIFRQMRTVYDLRSAIVHRGDTENVKLPEPLNDILTPLEDLVSMIQGYVRFALRKAIKLAVQPETPKELVNWDELIFSADGK